MASLNCALPAPTREQRDIGTDCNFLQALAASPTAATVFFSAETMLANGQLTPRERELIALVVAEINGSNYCLSAHYASAKNLGLSDEDILLARKASAFKAQEAALLRFTRAIVLQRGEVSDAELQHLKEAGYLDSQIAEIVSNAALNIFANYFNSVVRTKIDFPLLRPGEDFPGG